MTKHNIFYSDLTNPVIGNLSHAVQSEGSTATYTCFVEGTLPINLHWEKNNRIVATGAILHFSNITRNDESEYTCIVENSFGKKSTSFDLSVACKYFDYFFHVKCLIKSLKRLN